MRRKTPATYTEEMEKEDNELLEGVEVVVEGTDSPVLFNSGAIEEIKASVVESTPPAPLRERTRIYPRKETGVRKSLRRTKFTR
jgi:hypothetical protein